MDNPEKLARRIRKIPKGGN